MLSRTALALKWILKICVILIIMAAMAIWAILLAQVLNNWDNNSYTLPFGFNKVWYITNTCIPELFALIAIIAVLVGSRYWSQTCALVIVVFWINDHQRWPELFYYGSPLEIAAHALQLIVIAVLLAFGSIAGCRHYDDQPSRVANSAANAPPIPMHHINNGLKNYY